MEPVAIVIFIVVVLAIGLGHLKFSKRMSEDLIKTVKFRGKAEKEGGDNWPNLQLEMFNFDSSDDFTYADFEKENIQIKSKENMLCNRK